jgi:hypothetical protein
MLPRPPGQRRRKEKALPLQRHPLWPHGQTVAGLFENAEDYRAFEAAITADYDAESTVDLELVLGFGPDCYGGCAAPLQSRPGCLIFMPTI